MRSGCAAVYGYLFRHGYSIDGLFCLAAVNDRNRLEDLAKDNGSNPASVWHSINQFGLPYPKGPINDD